MLDEAAALGVLQVHFSGGEPTARKDLLQLVQGAARAGLYSNLITSGVMLDAASLGALADAGLDHVQLSFQDADAAQADRMGGYRDGHRRKLAVAGLIREAGLPLTANFVVHRQNLERLPEMLRLGEEIGASRIEIAHVQYYGWSLLNRAALMPTRERSLEAANAEVAAARERLHGRITIDYVVPDYYAARPKACMGGWARQIINVSPAGLALPCHAAETLPGFTWPNVRDVLAGRRVALRPRLHPLPRHGLDAGPLPVLRPARGGLGRLPLPSLRHPWATPPQPTRPAPCPPRIT